MNRAERRQQKKLARTKKKASGRRSAPVAAGGAQTENSVLRKADQLFRQGSTSEAAAICHQVLETNGEDAAANNLLGLIESRAGNLESALELLTKAIANAPENAAYRENIAIVLHRLGQHGEAVASCKEALAINPKSSAAHYYIGHASLALGQPEDAVQSYRRALALKPGWAEAHSNLGSALRQMGRRQEAAVSYQTAISIKSDSPGMHSNLGHVLRELGRLDDAVVSYRKALALDPSLVIPRVQIARTKSYTEYDDDLQTMERMWSDADTSEEQRMQLAFGLGKAFEDLKQFEKAIGFFTAGNELWRGLHGQRAVKKKVGLVNLTNVVDLVSNKRSPDFVRREANFNFMKKTFDSGLFAQHRDTGCADETPIFIVGMPRSGTTLVEQILASHSRVHGAGELGHLTDIAGGFLSGFSGKNPERGDAKKRPRQLRADRQRLRRGAQAARRDCVVHYRQDAGKFRFCRADQAGPTQCENRSLPPRRARHVYVDIQAAVYG